MSNAPADAASKRSLSDSDELELARLVTELTWRIDHGRAASVDELFIDEGELILGPDQVLSGRGAIQQWGTTIDQATWRIRHVITNMRFAAESDDSASGTTLVTAFMHEADQPSTTIPWTIGEDHDRFVRTAAGFRIASRRWETLFLRPSS